MEPLLFERMSKDGNRTLRTPKSASKRILFPTSPKDENSDSTLGHMSPLSSSPDRYSSPPPSPHWLLETPPRKNEQHWLNDSPFGPVQNKISTRKSPRLSPCGVHTKLIQKPACVTPLKSIYPRGNQKFEHQTEMELVEESPMKDEATGLMSPFKCLANKGKNGEKTPKMKSQALIIGESPEIFSPAAPIKVHLKSRPDDEVGTVMKLVEASSGTGTANLSSVPTSSFYHSSRARAALFPERLSRPRDSMLSVKDNMKRKRSLSNESFNSQKHYFSSGSRNRGVKRRKLGEINAGVHHKIKKLKKKKIPEKKYPAYTAQPKITPEERILSYLDQYEETSNAHAETNLEIQSTSKDPTNFSLAEKTVKYPTVPSAAKKPDPTPPSPPPDPSKKFFKTRRTLNIGKTATVTVDKNIQLKVRNGKFSLNTPGSKQNSNKIQKLHSMKTPSNSNNVIPELIGAEKSTAEVVQDSVHNNVEELLKKLEGSPKKNDLLEDVQSPDHHISALRSSPSSLVIGDDGPLLQPAEVVQDSVHGSVEDLLKKLEGSPEKNDLLADMLSPNHHISALTSSTSSLTIVDDGPLLQSALSTPQRPYVTPAVINGGTIVESSVKTSDSAESGFLFEDLPDEEVTDPQKENAATPNKLFPIFYKGSGNKSLLTDCTNTKSPRGTKRPWKAIGNDQYVIDAGQKKFGATQCKECGLVYQIGDPEDEISHQKYHNKTNELKYSTWKNERVVAYYGPERVILIKPNDNKFWQNKVMDVLKVVDKELGYADVGLGSLKNSQVFLYVKGKQVTGCVVAHPISQAYKMLNSVIEGCDCCSEESYPVKCGVSRVWVAKNYRRKKIASRILDCMRSTFVHGYIIGMDEFAFSAPTIDGKVFAEKYTGTVNYLVYT